MSVIQGVSSDAAALMLYSNGQLTFPVLKPPGTGKTNTIVAAIWLLKKRCNFEGPISVNAHTHKAIESLARKSISTGLKVVMIGKLSEDSGLEEHHIVGRLEKHAYWPILSALQTELSRLCAKRDTLKSDLAKLRTPRGRPPRRGRGFEEWQRLQKEMRMCACLL